MRKVSTGHVTGDSGEVLQQKFANIATATSGDNELVALVAAKKIRVVSIVVIATADVDAYFKSSGGTNIFGNGTHSIDLTANMGFSLPFNPGGWFETDVGEALEINLSGAVSIAGSLKYVEVA